MEKLSSANEATRNVLGEENHRKIEHFIWIWRDKNLSLVYFFYFWDIKDLVGTWIPEPKLRAVPSSYNLWVLNIFIGRLKNGNVNNVRKRQLLRWTLTIRHSISLNLSYRLYISKEVDRWMFYLYKEGKGLRQSWSLRSH